MIVMELVWAQKADPGISQVSTWIEDGKLSTMNVSEEMSKEEKAIFKAEETAVLERGNPALIQKSDSKRLQWIAISGPSKL